MELALEIVGIGTLLVLVLVTFIVLRAWPIEASLKAQTIGGMPTSLAAGVSLSGLSGSAAAILDGPGVVAVHFRTRELWRRTIPHVSLEVLLRWLDEQLSKEKEPDKPPGFFARMAKRIFKDWLLPRTDLTALPDLGIRVLGGLKDVSLCGGFTIGFSDPAHTGKAAAVLYPLAGVLSPLGTIDLSFDWSGKNVLDGDVELSMRVIPARLLREGLRFARHHIRLRRQPLPPAKKNEEETHGILEQQ
jgi:hypothetical protein